MPVYSWGRGEDGQLGIGDTEDQYSPVLLETLRDEEVYQIACGSGHTILLTATGEVWSCGRGDDGRLGHGDNGWKYVPRIIEGLKTRIIHQVTCGSYHTAVVTDKGELLTWGGGMYGKLGHGNENGHAVPRLVDALVGKTVTQVACGSRHTVALVREDHQVYSWGDLESGICGHGPITEEGQQQFRPKLIESLMEKHICQISACGFHTAARSQDGRIYTFGDGKFGRLGHNSEQNQLSAQAVASLDGQHIDQVSCGGFHTAVITNTGALYTFGGGEHGQLGHGDKVNKLVPCLVQEIRNQVVVSVTCGWSHSAILLGYGIPFQKYDSHVVGFITTTPTDLGHNDALKVTIPKCVEALKKIRVVGVASYNEHTVALTDKTATLPASVLTSSFSQDLRSLVNNQEFSDIAFIVEGVPVYAHRCILSNRSDHFRAMFHSGMRESFAQEITLRDIRHPVFLALMNYIYTDTVADVDPAMAIELYVAADCYTLSRLQGLCELVVVKGISVDNAATMLTTAHQLGHVSRMRDICMRYVINHFDAVSKTDAFQSLSRELILETIQNR